MADFVAEVGNFSREESGYFLEGHLIIRPLGSGTHLISSPDPALVTQDAPWPLVEVERPALQAVAGSAR